MENGLRIYHVEPLVEKVHYGESYISLLVVEFWSVIAIVSSDEQSIGGVGFSEMVYRTNLFAIVSGGSRPKYADNSVNSSYVVHLC